MHPTSIDVFQTNGTVENLGAWCLLSQTKNEQETLTLQIIHHHFPILDQKQLSFHYFLSYLPFVTPFQLQVGFQKYIQVLKPILRHLCPTLPFFFAHVNTSVFMCFFLSPTILISWKIKVPLPEWVIVSQSSMREYWSWISKTLIKQALVPKAIYGQWNTSEKGSLWYVI